MQCEIYTKARQEVQYLAGAEFNTKIKIGHYVNDRTRDWKKVREFTENSQCRLCKEQ